MEHVHIARPQMFPHGVHIPNDPNMVYGTATKNCGAPLGEGSSRRNILVVGTPSLTREDKLGLPGADRTLYGNVRDAQRQGQIDLLRQRQAGVITGNEDSISTRAMTIL